MPATQLSSDPYAEAASWQVRRRSDDCTDQERQDFLRWLNADDANRKAYQDAENLWQQMGDLETVAARQLHEARAHLAKSRPKPARRRGRGYALAAGITAVLAWNTGLLDFPDEHIYRTALGERQKLTLSDGSLLELDTNSEIVVRYSYRHRDLNLLRGQAVFTVAHGDSRPFDVHVDHGIIHDVGTQFQVRRFDDRVAVEVLAGNVEVSSQDFADVHPLHQGQRISYTRLGEFSAIEPVDLASSATWRDGKLVFHNQLLSEVIAELGRYHSDRLTVTTPQVMKIRVSGAFPVDDLPQALQTIAATLPVKLTRTGPQSWRLGD